MEPWEMELDFWTWDSYERAIAKANGQERVEEFTTDEQDFKSMVEELNRSIKPDDFDESQWEEVNG